ncbi:MAG TPA: chloride channel protein [Spirochaetota bacterium]
MKKKLWKEESIMFFSVVKWFFLATLIGIIVGLSTFVFLKSLNFGISMAKEIPYSILLLPVAMFLSVFIIKKFAPGAEGHGTEKVIEAVHRNNGKISFAVVPVKLLTTIITISFGGSAGKEGPCAQIGAGLASTFSDFFRFRDYERKKLVICGISAGFASVFGTPVAGALFGIEVLVVGQLMYDVLFPSFIAGITAYQVTHMLGISYFYKPLHFIPVFSEMFFLQIILSGIFFGLVSFFLIETMKFFKYGISRILLPIYVKAIAAGAIMALFGFFVTTRPLGLGVDHIEKMISGSPSAWYDPVLKTLFTGLTLNAGGSGGVITPIFFIGSTSGNLFGRMMGLDPSTFAAIGMVALLAGAANTPIAASVMSIELFGPEIAPYAAVACVISFLMTGHRSIYPSQVLGMNKSYSIRSSIGKEIEGAKIIADPENRTFLRYFQKKKK